MAKIFLDTNVFVDLVEKRKQITLAGFFKNELFISPLSVHILTYLYKLPRLEKPRFSCILSLHPLRPLMPRKTVTLLRLHPHSERVGFWRSGYKYHIPSEKLSDVLEGYINFVPFDKKIVLYASNGPTKDFEDNVQLHSAAEAECDLFLTNDEKLLDMKFFGKTRILPGL